MTRLDAINEMLSARGESPVTALDSTGSWPSKTYGSSDQGLAERILDRHSRRLQADGTVFNRLDDYVIELPTVKIAASGGAGTFTFGETITESTSAATGTFNYETGGYVYIAPLTGTFAGGYTLTGGTSGATRTGAAVSTLTSGRIAVNSTWLHVDASASESRRIKAETDSATSIKFLFDLDPDDDATVPFGTLFDSSVRIDAVAEIEFTLLPELFAAYVVKSAAMDFQRSTKRGQTDDQMIQQELIAARAAWMRQESDTYGVNILATNDAFNVRGGRSGPFIAGGGL